MKIIATHCKTCKKLLASKTKYVSEYCPQCRPKPTCIDCGIEISGYEKKRCRKCSNIFNALIRQELNLDKPKLEPKHRCVDCGKPVQRTRCWECYKKFKLKQAEYMHGVCIDCKKIIGLKSIRCHSCNNTFLKTGKPKVHPIGCKCCCCDTDNKVYKTGSDHPSWTNSLNVRLSKWSKEIRKRDNYTCQICKKSKNELKSKALHAHHIKPKLDFPDLALDMDNGITLCNACHVMVENMTKYNNISKSNQVLKDLYERIQNV